MKVISIRENGSTRVCTINNEPSMAQQHMKDQCDVNLIIAKYKKTGQISHIAKNQGSYLDLTQIPDYLTSLITVKKAEEAFMTLPSKIRQRFAHNPKEFIDYLNDPKNKEEAINLGLFEKPKSPIPSPSPISQTPPKLGQEVPVSSKP